MRLFGNKLFGLSLYAPGLFGLSPLISPIAPGGGSGMGRRLPKYKRQRDWKQEYLAEEDELIILLMQAIAEYYD